MRRFNVTGLCVPKMHYMVDISDKLVAIMNLIENGNYFTINRGRQYGKTTTLSLLEKRMPKEYTVISISFEGASDITRACKEFCYGWERPGIPHEDKRLEYAAWYLSALKRPATVNDITSAAYLVAENATPYVYGGNSIWGGCDCSYFTQWCYAQAGISIPRQSEAQRDAGRVIAISEAESGDILWMFGHVGIYIDENTVIEQTPSYCRVTSITYNAWQCAVRFE